MGRHWPGYPHRSTGARGWRIAALVTALVTLLLLTGAARAGDAYLVKDVNPGSADSLLSWFTEVDGTLFFRGFDPANGTELWRSDGTAASTFVVRDINADSGRSNPHALTDIDGTLFFSATDGVSGNALWVSDGSRTGTTLVRPVLIYLPENPNGIVASGTTAFFVGSEDGLNRELWKSDGSTAGTFMIKDIIPGDLPSLPEHITDVGGIVFFSALTVDIVGDDLGRELWKSDGTAAGTTLVEDISPGEFGSGPISLTDFNGVLLFSANDGVNGQELWKSDGTGAGTQLVKDIWPGPNSGGAAEITQVDGIAFFRSLGDGSTGAELWKSDGTEAGTQLVKDINPGATPSFIDHLTNVDGTLFFSADDGVNGQELWKSDGTTAGTVMVRDVNPGPGSSISAVNSELINANGTLYFSADDGANGMELWRSDGTPGGTVRVDDINPGAEGSFPLGFTVSSGILLFNADEPVHGRELWGLPLSSNLLAAVLPASRSVRIGDPATAFATIINAPGGETAIDCSIAPPTGLPADFLYQTTNPSTNELTGTPNTPVDIEPGASQSYLFAFTPTAEIASTDVELTFDCENTGAAPVVTGLNSLLLSASGTPIPDIVALSATAGSIPGTADIPGSTGSGFFSVATVNVGASGTISITADTGSASGLPVALSLCETDPVTAQCINPAVPTPGPVITTIGELETPTVSIFVTGAGTVPFDPANNRVFVRFQDVDAVTRGSTSVAVQTLP